MNREKESQLPLMQVNFIDSICIPVYEVRHMAQGIRFECNIYKIICVLFVGLFSTFRKIDTAC